MAGQARTLLDLTPGCLSVSSPSCFSVSAPGCSSVSAPQLLVNIGAQCLSSNALTHSPQTTAAIFLAPIACLRERNKETKLTPRVLSYLFLSALIGATLSQYLFLLGLQQTSASFSSAFVNMAPANTFLMALTFRLEKLNLKSKGGKAKVLGSFVCIGGVLLLALYRGFPISKSVHSQESIYRSKEANMKASGKSTENYIMGSILFTSSAFLWSSWFVMQARIGKRYPCKYSSTATMSFFSAVQSAILCVAINDDVSIWLLKGKLQIFSVLFAGTVGSGLCYSGMSWCVEQKGPVFTAAFSPFMQIFVAILDLAFLHEQIYLGSVLGSLIVIVGLYILLWGKSKDTADSIAKPAEADQDNGRSGPSTSCSIQVTTN
ncbi:hypothetical protein Nepgr_023616 [Nepenthes gracilis]|uniref:WAT1-related protein n=1 Tax=Nepenthes gracilis TaxID=150966 RepID=A0AAD3T354_NEPGR|nr:hypothetical protein Nepgr_023616 [Nepenthes gracilis]